MSKKYNNKYNYSKNKYCNCGKIISNYATLCQSCRNKGVLNPAYKTGLPNCIDCGKKLSDYSYQRCQSCENIRRYNLGIINNKGETNPNWQEGISKLPYAFEFDKILKESIRKRDNYQCLNCGMTEEEHIIVWGEVLHVHHIDYNKQNCKEDNLATTCRSCNIRANYNREYWKEFYRNKICLKSL